MSKSGSRYLRTKKEAERQRWKKTPVIQFIKSLDFIGKFGLGILLYGMFITDSYFLQYHPTLITVCAVSIFFYPFAKKGADDSLRRYTSERKFEFISNGHGIRALYTLIVMLFAIPLGIGYFLYHYWQYRHSTK